MDGWWAGWVTRDGRGDRSWQWPWQMASTQAYVTGRVSRNRLDNRGISEWYGRGEGWVASGGRGDLGRMSTVSYAQCTLTGHDRKDITIENRQSGQNGMWEEQVELPVVVGVTWGVWVLCHMLNAHWQGVEVKSAVQGQENHQNQGSCLGGLAGMEA